MTSLTKEQLALRDAGNRKAYYESLFSVVRRHREHWWCTLPAVMQEIVPLLEPTEALMTMVTGQVAKCRKCARCYHKGVGAWHASAPVRESEAQQVVSSLRAMDEDRIVPQLQSSVRSWVNMRMLVQGSAEKESRLETFRQECEDFSHELLADLWLTSRIGVQRAIGDMFVRLNPVKEETDRDFFFDTAGACLPGLYVLCFHDLPMVRGWAQRSLQKYPTSKSTAGEERAGECGGTCPDARVVLEHCAKRVDVFLGTCVVDLTEDDVALPEESELIMCSPPVFWEGFAVLVEHFRCVKILDEFISSHSALMGQLVRSISERRPYVANSAVRVVRHLVTVLSHRVWLKDNELRPDYVVDELSHAFSECDGSDAKKECILEIFPSLVTSLAYMSKDVVEDTLKSSSNFLFDACTAPRQNYRNFFMGISGPVAQHGTISGKTAMFKLARRVTIRVAIACYQHLPKHAHVVSTGRLADVLEEIIRESPNPDPESSQLLQTILSTDALSIVRFMTSPLVANLAKSARPRHIEFHQGGSTGKDDTAALCAHDRTDSGMLAAVDKSAADKTIDAGAETKLGVFEGVQEGDEKSAHEEEFRWSETVWEKLLSGKFRVTPLTTSQSERNWPEGEALLDVHACIGMLDAPSENGMSADARKHAASNPLVSLTFGPAPSELSRAYVTAMEAVETQLKRAVESLGKSSCNETWLELVPQAAGHLMSSTRRSIRTMTLKILAKLSPVPGTHIAPSDSSKSGPDTSVVRKLLGDDDLGCAVMAGTGDAARLLSVYGSTLSLQSYLHMARWVYQLFATRMPVVDVFLENNGQEQVSCMMEQFILNWESHQESPLYAEAMSRVLSQLVDLWEWLIDAQTDQERQRKHLDLIDVLLVMRGCTHPSIQGNWTRLLNAVVPRYGKSKSQRDVISDLLECSQNSPCGFVSGHCKDLTDAFGLPLVKYPRDTVVGTPSPSNDSEVISSHDNTPVFACESSASSAAWRANSTALLRRSKNKASRSIRSSGPSRDMERLRSVTTRLRICSDGQRERGASGMVAGHGSIGLRGVLAQRNRARGTVRTRQPVKQVRTGPTPIELQRMEAIRLEEEKKRLRSSGVSSHAGLDGGKKDSRVVGMRRTSPLPGPRRTLTTGDTYESNVHGSNNPGAEKTTAGYSAAEVREASRAARRVLKPRRIEAFHGGLLGRSVSEIMKGRDAGELSKSLGPRPEYWKTSEQYVCYFEGLLWEETFAQIRQQLEDEERVAQDHPPLYDDGVDTWACRTPFEAVGPPTSHKSGHFKEIVIKYSGAGFLRDSALPKARGGKTSSFDDRSAAGLATGDLVRLQMVSHGRGHALGSHGSPEFVVLLGCVSSVEHRGASSNVTVKVRFPGGVQEPGPERAFAVSRLLSMAPLNRQREALWRVNKLSDDILHMLLHPRSCWKERKREAANGLVGSSLTLTPSRCRILSALSQRGLNSSQQHIIKVTGELVSGWKGPVPQGRGITLLQGPPGTGKSSTILSILSVLLAPSLSTDTDRIRPVLTNAPSSVGRPVRHVASAEMQVPVAPYRVLVCAPSNAAVDELLTRVLDHGILTVSGGYACPRVVRVGSGSKEERLLPVTISEMISKYKKSQSKVSNTSDSASATTGRDESDRRGAFETQRRMLRELSAKIGVIHNERVGKRDELTKVAASKKLPKERRRALEKQLLEEEKKLTEQLTRLHDEKRVLSLRVDSAGEEVAGDAKHREWEENLRISKIINSAAIVFSTLNSAAHEILAHSCQPFDAVVVDEAAQSVEPDVLIPLVGVKTFPGRPVRHCFLVGDPNQLPATVLSTATEVSKRLSLSLFGRLQSTKRSVVHMLKTQYRMHPLLARFPSNHFYDAKLKNGSCVRGRSYHQPYHYDRGARFGPLTFLDTSSSSRASEQRSSSGTSIANIGEAQIVGAVLRALFQTYPEEMTGHGKVAVLTPYKQQVNVIRREIQRDLRLERAGVEVGTVDGIQGREKEIVVLSTVRSSSAAGIGFVRDEKRMNVALTRAKLSLIVVGNAQSLSNGSTDWAAFITHCRSENCVKHVTSPRDMFPEAFIGDGGRPSPPAVVPDSVGVAVPQLLDDPAESTDSEAESALALSDWEVVPLEREFPKRSLNVTSISKEANTREPRVLRLGPSPGAGSSKLNPLVATVRKPPLATVRKPPLRSAASSSGTTRILEQGGAQRKDVDDQISAFQGVEERVHGSSLAQAAGQSTNLRQSAPVPTRPAGMPAAKRGGSDILPSHNGPPAKRMRTAIGSRPSNDAERLKAVNTALASKRSSSSGRDRQQGASVPSQQVPRRSSESTRPSMIRTNPASSVVGLSKSTPFGRSLSAVASDGRPASLSNPSTQSQVGPSSQPNQSNSRDLDYSARTGMSRTCPSGVQPVPTPGQGRGLPPQSRSPYASVLHSSRSSRKSQSTSNSQTERPSRTSQSPGAKEPTLPRRDGSAISKSDKATRPGNGAFSLLGASKAMDKTVGARRRVTGTSRHEARK